MFRQAIADSIARMLNPSTIRGFPQVELALRLIVAFHVEYILTAGCR